jgi:uncharacterized protein YggT (Ycf19 family)
VIVLDYLLGVIMWTLIGRAAMNLFLPVDSDFFFMKAFVRLTDPILKVFRPITPGFLVEPVVPLFVAWFFFLFRFYVMPWLLGYSVMACSPSRSRATSRAASTRSSAAATDAGRDDSKPPADPTPVSLPSSSARTARICPVHGLCMKCASKESRNRH